MNVLESDEFVYLHPDDSLAKDAYLQVSDLNSVPGTHKVEREN